MRIEDIIQSTKTATSIYRFVTDGSMLEIVNEVGDIHMSAAAAALSRLTLASDVTGELRSVITHLQAAHAAYEKGWRKLNNILGSIAWNEHDTFLKRDVQSVILMIMCYIAIGEYRMAQSYISILKATAAECQMPDDSLEFGEGVEAIGRYLLLAASVFNVSGIYKAYLASKDPYLNMGKGELARFVRLFCARVMSVERSKE